MNSKIAQSVKHAYYFFIKENIFVPDLFEGAIELIFKYKAALICKEHLNNIKIHKVYVERWKKILNALGK